MQQMKQMKQKAQKAQMSRRERALQSSRSWLAGYSCQESIAAHCGVRSHSEAKRLSDPVSVKDDSEKRARLASAAQEAERLAWEQALECERQEQAEI